MLPPARTVSSFRPRSFSRIDFVELRDVERCWRVGEAGQQRSDGFGLWGQQKVSVAGGGDEGYALGVVEVLEQGRGRGSGRSGVAWIS